MNVNIQPMRYGGIDLKAESAGKGQGIKMTREEIADELFSAGKEVKQCFLSEIAVGGNGRSWDFVYSQYMQLLNNLNILYNSLETGKEGLDRRIAGLLENREEKAFSGCFVSILDEMLINTIKYRKKYCLIRRNDRVPGIASHIITNLGQIALSLNSGYIPVVDTVKADNAFSELSKACGQNAWELYFRQPMGETLEEGMGGAEVKVLEGIPDFMPNYQMDTLMNPDLMAFWRGMRKTYMPLSDELEKSIHSSVDRLPFGTGERILGVLCRGTDYTNMRPYNHPVQPPLDAVLAKADELMGRHQCHYCYLATEDEEIRNIFRNKLGDRLLTTQEIYYKSDLKDTINQTNIDCHIDIHQKNMEYLTALALLSRCHCLIGGRTSGTVVALLLSQGFEETCLWDLGRYGVDDGVALSAYIH